MEGFLIGADGGGTKTEFIITDMEGNRVSGGRLGPMNPFSPKEVLAETARGLARAITAVEGECARLAVACAGAGESEMAARVQAELAAAGVSCPITVYGDHENALFAAFGEGDGAVLIAGTGSVCFGRRNGVYHRSGGRGHVIDDGGSGYAIGRDMLSAVVRASDGRADRTALTRLVTDFCGTNDIAEITTRFTDPALPKSEIAALAPLLSAAVSSGDEAAREIQERAAAELASLAIAVLSALPGIGQVAFTGSVLTYGRSLRAMVSALIKERFPLAECSVCYTRGAEGAAAYALALEKANG